mmetsp:Transcript_24672/g.40634  ORF Transcript_24672/g.40634 Transcript_24672/m.40634 type:complete len:106 (-) Transcript_24672:3357-3674(-)
MTATKELDSYAQGSLKEHIGFSIPSKRNEKPCNVAQGDCNLCMYLPVQLFPDPQSTIMEEQGLLVLSHVMKSACCIIEALCHKGIRRPIDLFIDGKAALLMTNCI